MAKLLRIIVVLIAVLFVCRDAGASTPLTLDEVLDSVDASHPDLESARLGVDAADGRALAARGGFDPTLAMRSVWTPVGYYSNGRFDATVRQPTPLWGAGVYAGYRIGWGRFPVYDAGLDTLSGGEVRAGIDIPVWRDGPIDDRRAAIQRAKARRDEARQVRDATRLELEREAAYAYWDWVAAGQSLRVARELLAIAESRADGLEVQASEGAIERIKVVDNRRLVLDREARAVDAERAFEQASVRLSLYLRDAQQQPVRVSEPRVPPGFPEPRPLDIASIEDEVAAAIARRPDVSASIAARRATAVDVRLAKNRMAPNVNLQSFVAKDFGDGPSQLRPVEWGAGVVFEMPLPLRGARGEHRAARAELASRDALLRGLRDRVEAELRSAHVALRAAVRTVGIAREQVAAASDLAEAERVLFREGNSDLVVVNLRELAAADAANQEIETLADYHRAHADYMVASGRRPNG